jgi:hypothetical protein
VEEKRIERYAPGRIYRLGGDDLGTSRPFAAGHEKLRPGGKTARDSFER